MSTTFLTIFAAICHSMKKSNVRRNALQNPDTKNCVTNPDEYNDNQEGLSKYDTKYSGVNKKSCNSSRIDK